MRKLSWNRKTYFALAGFILLALTWVLSLQSSGSGDETVPTLSDRPVFESFPGYKPDVTSDTVLGRLRSAERIWARSHVANDEAQKVVKLQKGVDHDLNIIIWDLFYPSFDCPYVKERIGRVGDGGKWICGFELLQSKPQCTVFSFGISREMSFEEEFLRRTSFCVVHMFDPTIFTEPLIVAKYPDRAIFHVHGIGAENKNDMGTLKTIMNSLSVKEIDVLKMDIEGAEWASMDNMFTDFPQGLPFAQIQIEVHLHKGPLQEDWLKKLRSWFDLMEGAGFRQFFQEPNLYTVYEPIVLRELAFVNVKMNPFKLI